MAFTASTKDVLERLGLNSYKTLFRRRTDYHERRKLKLQQFLEHGIHFRKKSPDSNQLVWDLELTERAWKQAIDIRHQQSA